MITVAIYRFECSRLSESDIKQGVQDSNVARRTFSHTGAVEALLCLPQEPLFNYGSEICYYYLSKAPCGRS